MLDGIDNLSELSLSLNEFTTNFQTIQELPGIEKRPTSWRQRQSGIGTLCYMIVRRKPEQTFVFRVLYAVNLHFPLLT